ncbi:MAG TPA: hypothetical protein V6D18_02550 [Thermosynechococcaceae cyanobacterium]|jgi:hypothetical protein
MLIFVLICNGAIGLGCLFVAWTLWQIKRQLAQAVDSMIDAEKAVHGTLYSAPGFITIGQINIRGLRKNLPNLDAPLQRLQRAIGLLNLMRSLWLGRSSFKKR